MENERKHGADGEGEMEPAPWVRRAGALCFDVVVSGLIALGAVVAVWAAFQSPGAVGHAFLHRLAWFSISFVLFWIGLACVAGAATLASISATPGQWVCRIETRMLNGEPLSGHRWRALARSVLGVVELICFVALGLAVLSVYSYMQLPGAGYFGYPSALMVGAVLPTLLFGERTLSERLSATRSIRCRPRQSRLG